MSDRPSAEALIARARALAPVLKERAPETSELRRLPDATIADMQEAGLFRVMQPARFGGFEHDPRTFFAAQQALATGCPSTAWVYGVVAVHAWQLALFEDRAQQDVWGTDTSTLVSSSYMPVGKVTPAEDGFRLSGRWSFSSGSDHCDWIFLGAFCPTGPDARGPDLRTFLVPRADYEIIDNWHTSSLRGTGSKDIVVDDVYVPEYRTHKFSDGYRCRNPGNEVNTAPLYRLPFGQVFVRSVSTTALGILEGATEAFLEIARAKVGQADGAKAAEQVRTQEVIAHARATLDELRLVLDRNMGAMMARVEAGDKIPIEDRVRYRYDSSRVVVRCTEAVDALFTASGGRALFEDHPLNRYFQDIHGARAHFANNPDKPSRNLGAVELGLRNTDYFL